MKNSFFLLSMVALLLTSCVGKRKYLEMQTRANQCQDQLGKLQSELTERGNTSRNLENELLGRNTELQIERNKVKGLEQQIENLKANNNNLLQSLSDLSVVSKTGAESIQKSLETLNQQNKYIQGLTSSMQRKDSLNLVLVMNIKRSLDNINDEDVTVEVKKGVVYVSISDKMLFKSGSSEISARAEEVLGKIAKVVNDHRELDILVEGHTDNVPISNSCIKDNWDLSAMRATSVVRTLQKKYGVAPERMTAGGRSEFVPKMENTTAPGKAANRRTEIVILPKLDQFFQLLEQPQAGGK
jgi:chemotaxis protein MotB